MLGSPNISIGAVRCWSHPAVQIWSDSDVGTWLRFSWLSQTLWSCIPLCWLCAGGGGRGKMHWADSTNISEQRSTIAQPIAAYNDDILEWTSGALSPAASYWHINNTINLICYWVLRDRLLTPAEQKAMPKGEMRGHQPYGRAGGPSI